MWGSQISVSAVQYVVEGALKKVLSIIPTKNGKNGTPFGGKMKFSTFPTNNQIPNCAIFRYRGKHFCAASTLLFFLRSNSHLPFIAASCRVWGKWSMHPALSQTSR
jgi:hypothetical protein